MIKAIKNLFKKRQRSVVFYRHSYYHFYYLAKALRKRGWDAIVVNLEPTNSSNANYYHNEDLNLYDENPAIFHKNIKRFFKSAKSRFKLMHFAGDGVLSFFPEYITVDNPPDIIAWKKNHNKIAYTVSGCNSGVSKDSVAQWSMVNNGLNACDRCVWQENTDVCSNEKNLSWGKKAHQYCDLIFAETAPALDYMQSTGKIVRGPVTACLDPEFWPLNLKIPKEHLIQAEEDEILIYHAVGNFEIRNTNTKNIKGTPFIFNAIEKLKKEGHKVKLIFITDKPNTVVRYYQTQAHIIVDQLNSGRYGATARECMMLGKPVICYLNKFEYNEEDKLQCLEECPLISATEQTIYEELKKLIINPELRQEIGIKSREYALKWHAADACAERYEQIYDKLFE